MGQGRHTLRSISDPVRAKAWWDFVRENMRSLTRHRKIRMVKESLRWCELADPGSLCGVRMCVCFWHLLLVCWFSVSYLFNYVLCVFSRCHLAHRVQSHWRYMTSTAW